MLNAKLDELANADGANAKKDVLRYLMHMCVRGGVRKGVGQGLLWPVVSCAQCSLLEMC